MVSRPYVPAMTSSRRRSVDIKALEQRYELADARLGVSVDFGWMIAWLSAFLAGASLHWLAVLILLSPMYFSITKPYRTAAARAEDAYQPAAGIGEYARAFRGDDA